MSDNKDDNSDIEKDDNIMDNDFENEFEPKSDIEENAQEEKYLNKNLGNYIPSALVYTVTALFIGGGFVIGFLTGNLGLGGTICGLEMMQQLTADPTAISSGGNLLEGMKSQIVGCTTRSAITPLPLISGVILGSIIAYPSYKISKSVSEGKHLRSII